MNSPHFYIIRILPVFFILSPSTMAVTVDRGFLCGKADRAQRRDIRNTLYCRYISPNLPVCSEIHFYRNKQNFEAFGMSLARDTVSFGTFFEYHAVLEVHRFIGIKWMYKLPHVAY